MIVGVADTHAVLWLLFGDQRLSTTAREFIDEAAARDGEIAVCTISLAEIVYLSEKKRLPVNAYQVMKDALTDPDHVLREMPLTVPIVEALRTVSREHTSVHLKVPLITCDKRIQAASPRVVW